MATRITADEFRELTRPLVGLPISRPWRGYGSAAFFELGRLHERKYKNGKASLEGKATIMIEWSWRVERPRSIYGGSFSLDKKLTNSILKLEGLVVEDILTEGRLPELSVSLSKGWWLRSFMTAAGQPQWVIYLPDFCLHSRQGHLYKNEWDKED